MKQPCRLIVALGAALVSVQAYAAVTLDFVYVGDPGNLADPLTGRGAVSDPFLISKYEVTNSQYCEFLNAVAADDPNNLYSTNMAVGNGGITRAGASGSYTYAVRAGRGNKPVTWVSRHDSARFANWLQNGQPIGAQGPGTTEAGTYSPPNPEFLNRSPGANYFVPDDDEWYKAAYYKGGASNAYWKYATQSNALPTSEVPAGGANSANFYYDDGVANGVNGGYALTQSTAFNPNSNYLTDVGAYATSASFYGTFDQTGNVWEWTEAGGQALRGGGWNGPGTSNAGPDALASTYNYFEFGVHPGYERDQYGFRIAAVTTIPEPSVGFATAVLLLLGGAGQFGRGRKKPMVDCITRD